MQVHPALIQVLMAEREREVARQAEAARRTKPARRPRPRPAAPVSAPGTLSIWIRMRGRREAT